MRKSAFAFVMVPTVIIGEAGPPSRVLYEHAKRVCCITGALYANVACKYVYRRIMKDSRHAHSHSVIGWGTWMGLQVVFWAIAFVLGETIPSMGDFLGMLSRVEEMFPSEAADTCPSFQES